MPGQRIRVVFFLQRPEAWVNIGSVWSAMQNDARFEPVVWLLPYNAADQATSAARAPLAREFLDEIGVPYVDWRGGMAVGKGEFDVAVFIHPYDRERPAPLSFKQVAAAVPFTIYIPYGLPVGGGFKNLQYQYVQPTQVQASAVIARSEFEKAQYRKHCPSGDRHVHVLGHPRFDVLLEALAAPIPLDVAEFCGDRKVLLWSSHFAFGLSHSQVSNFSTFDIIGPELFDYVIRNRDDLCLLWRPHPGLIPALVRDGILGGDEIVELRHELKINGILFDETPDHAMSFSVSDALIADPGSFLIEYLATGKPILALTNPDGEPLNEEGKVLVSRYRQASNPQQVEGFIAEFRSGALAIDLEEARAFHLPILDRCSGQHVVQLAKSLVDGCLEPASEHRTHLPETARTQDRFRPAARSLPYRTGPTPTIDKLCRSLREIRNIKAQESEMRKIVRRRMNTTRSWCTEALKRYPSAASWLDSRRARRGNSSD